MFLILFSTNVTTNNTVNTAANTVFSVTDFVLRE